MNQAEQEMEIRMDRKKKRDPLAVSNLINERQAMSSTAQQCTATSKRTGQRCQNWAIRGAKTCRMHGSATRKARTAAAERISEASGYAADMLVEFMADPTVEIKVRVQLAQDILNRAGLNQQNIAVQMQDSRWADVMAGVLIDVGDDDPRIAYVARPSAEDVIDAEVLDQLPETHVQPTPSKRIASAKSRQAPDEQADVDAARERLLRRRIAEDRFQPDHEPRRRRRS